MAGIRAFLEMIRFSHTLFALPFALLSAALAWCSEPFRILDLVGILLCMVFARSTAMAFNRIVDRDIDARNPRTAKRHIPAGSISLGSAIAFTLICAVGFVGSTVLFNLREPANPWPLYLSGPVLFVICFYSLTKRFTSLAHVWLGLSLMLAPVAAWIAIRGLTEMTTPLVLGVAVLFWVTGFDILYACQDADFDRKAKLHSVPAKLGIRGSLRVAAFSHLLMVVMLVLLYLVTPQLENLFLIGIILVAILLAYEHAIVSADDMSRVNQAFFQVNGLISIGLLGIGILQILIRW